MELEEDEGNEGMHGNADNGGSKKETITGNKREGGVEQSQRPQRIRSKTTIFTYDTMGNPRLTHRT